MAVKARATPFPHVVATPAPTPEPAAPAPVPLTDEQISRIRGMVANLNRDAHKVMFSFPGKLTFALMTGNVDAVHAIRVQCREEIITQVLRCPESGSLEANAVIAANKLGHEYCDAALDILGG